MTNSESASGLPRRVLILHGTLTIIIPYLHTRVRTYALARAWPDAPSGDQRHKAWDILTKIESTCSTLGLLSFVLFIWDGRFAFLFSLDILSRPLIIPDIVP